MNRANILTMNSKDPLRGFYFDRLGKVHKDNYPSILSVPWDELTPGQQKDIREHADAVRRIRELKETGKWPTGDEPRRQDEK